MRSQHRFVGILVSLAASLSPVAGVPPAIQEVDPGQTMGDVDTAVTVNGAGFEPGASASLVDGGIVRIGDYYAPWSFPTPSVAVSDGFAFVGERWGLRALDVRDPARVYRAGFLPEVTPADVEAHGGFAYVLDRSQLLIVDVRDPFGLLSPTGSLALPSWLLRIALTGPLALVADVDGSLHVVDVADPQNPRLLASWSAESPIRGIAADGRTAYVARAGALDVLDLGEPSAPRRVGSVTLATDPQDVAVRGSYAYLSIRVPGSREGGIAVADVRDPRSPAIVGEWREAGLYAWRVATNRDHVFLSAALGPTRVLDASDPTVPVPIATIAGAFDGSVQSDLATTDGMLFSVRPDGLEIWDVGHPKGPPSPSLAIVDTAGSARDIATAGRLGYVADGERGLRVLDLSDAAAPRDIGGVASPGDARAVALAGDKAYLATGTDGLRVADIRDPAAPLLVGHWASPQPALDVAVSGGFAYLAAGRLEVVDLRDPGLPNEIGFVELPYAAHAVAVSGALAFVAAYDTLYIVDVAQPSHPTVVGWFAEYNGSLVADVAAVGSTAFMVDGFGTHVLDVSDPTAPVRTGYLGGFGIWYDGWSSPEGDLEVRGDRAFLARSWGGPAGQLLVGDLRDPGNPVPAGSYALPGSAFGVEFDGEHGIVACGTSGVALLHPDPPLRGFASPSASMFEMTVPAGFRPGPYHLTITNPGGESATAANALLVCERHALRAALQPRFGEGIGPGPVSHPTWRLALDGDDHFFLPRPRHEAAILLPDLPESIETRGLPGDGSGRMTIEIRLVPGASTGVVDLIGDDAEEVRALWEGILAAGSIALARTEDRAYGDYRLSIGPAAMRTMRRVAPGGIAPARPGVSALSPRSYRYVFDGARLTEAAASGNGTDLVFLATTRDDYGCATTVRTSYREELRRLCQDIGAANPELALACER